MSRFSTGIEFAAASAVISSRASASRRAATGSRSAHDRGSGGPSLRGDRTGRSASSSALARLMAATQRAA